MHGHNHHAGRMERMAWFAAGRFGGGRGPFGGGMRGGGRGGAGDMLRAGRLLAPFGFAPSGQDYVALRRARRHAKSALFCDWLRAEAQRFEAAPGAA